MSDAPEGGTVGLRRILLATGLAGGIGYVIQFLVPQLAPTSYLGFATSWSAIYLAVTCLSGVQQEVTRASQPIRPGDASSAPLWAKYTSAVTVISAIAVGSVLVWIGPRVFPESPFGLSMAVIVAAIGYSAVASLSGVLYGARDWSAAASLTIADATMRLAAVGIVLALSGTVLSLAWATAIPFTLAAVLVWGFAGRRAVLRTRLSDTLPRLLRNTVATLAASMAMGLLISGLPLLLQSLVAGIDQAILASVILVITLTRAPIIVPLLALQGFLLVRFRDAKSIGRMALLWALSLTGVTVAASMLAAILGPSLLGWIFPAFAPLSPEHLAIIVISAGATGVLCVTGPATLSQGQHGWYLAGWMIAAAVTVGFFLAPLAPLERILWGLVTGPLVGAGVHAFGLLFRSGRRSIAT